MRRLLHTLLLPLVLGGALLLPAQVAVADAGDVPAGVVRLATEAEGDVGGLEPGGANSTENANRPEDYEPNFLWAAAVGLSVLTVGGLVALAALYRLMVVRKQKEPSAS